MVKTVRQETHGDTITNLTVRLHYSSHHNLNVSIYLFTSLRVMISSNQLFMFYINNNVFLSTLFFNVSINNIVVAKCKSTLGGGLYM